MRKLLHSKIHGATVTGARLDYEGSIAIDAELIEAARLLAYEAVHVWNVSNGARIETYVIPAPAGSGEICLNGAAARWFHPGDRVIIASFCWLTPEQARSHRPRIVIADEHNRVHQLIGD